MRTTKLTWQISLSHEQNLILLFQKNELHGQSSKIIKKVVSLTALGYIGAMKIHSIFKKIILEHAKNISHYLYIKRFGI